MSPTRALPAARQVALTAACTLAVAGAGLTLGTYPPVRGAHAASISAQPHGSNRPSQLAFTLGKTLTSSPAHATDSSRDAACQEDQMTCISVSDGEGPRMSLQAYAAPAGVRMGFDLGSVRLLLWIPLP